VAAISTPVVTVLNSVSKIPMGGFKLCFFNMSFLVSDTYATGGFDPRPSIRKLFGVRDVLDILFLGGSSNAIGTTTYGTSRVQPRFTFTPGKFGISEASTVKLFAMGRTAASTVVASEVEIGNADNVRGATGTGLTFQGVALCRGEGATYDSIGANS
jgi:hypothetical protein